MCAEGAFWLYDTADGEWRYFLITSLFNVLGSREIYLRLNKALEKKLSERETRRFNLFIGSPKESLVATVRAIVTTSIYASDPTEIWVDLNSEHTRAIVYRMASPVGDDAARRAKARFRKLSNQLIAA